MFTFKEKLPKKLRPKITPPQPTFGLRPSAWEAPTRTRLWVVNWIDPLKRTFSPSNSLPQLLTRARGRQSEFIEVVKGVQVLTDGDTVTWKWEPSPVPPSWVSPLDANQLVSSLRMFLVCWSRRGFIELCGIWLRDREVATQGEPEGSWEGKLRPFMFYSRGKYKIDVSLYNSWFVFKYFTVNEPISFSGGSRVCVTAGFVCVYVTVCMCVSNTVCFLYVYVLKIIYYC